MMTPEGGDVVATMIVTAAGAECNKIRSAFVARFALVRRVLVEPCGRLGSVAVVILSELLAPRKREMDAGTHPFQTAHMVT
jgi:hypothetical protein